MAVAVAVLRIMEIRAVKVYIQAPATSADPDKDMMAALVTTVVVAPTTVVAVVAPAATPALMVLPEAASVVQVVLGP
jgi:hypothetical protein